MVGSGRDLIASFAVRVFHISDNTVWRHVELITGKGLIGVGEFSYPGAPTNISAIAERGAARLTGQPVGAAAMVTIGDFLSAGFAHASVYSALEQAMVDLEAQIAGRTIHRYLAGQTGSGPVPLYANINRRTTDRSPDGVYASANDALSAGFSAIKIAPFDGLSAEMCVTGQGREHIEAGLERVAAMGRVAQGRAELMVDCHWRFDPCTAIEVLDSLADLGVVWIECPIEETPQNIDSLVAIRREANARGLRLAGLETQIGWPGFQPYVEAGAYDVIMPDIKHAGGYRISMDIARKALAAGIGVSLHNPTGPVGHAASVQLTLAIGTGERLEVQFDESPLFRTITDPAPAIEEGSCWAPQAPGLGLCLRANG